MRLSRSTTTIQVKPPEIERFKCEPEICHFNLRKRFPARFFYKDGSEVF